MPVLRARVTRPAPLLEVARQPPAHDAQHRDDGVDGHEVNPAVLDVEAARRLEVVGQPDQEEPPDRIRHELRDDEAPGLAVPEGAPVAERRAAGGGFVLVARNVGQLGR